jgi:hypothetical protein
MKQLKITTTASAIVTLDGLDVDEVIKQAADLAHEVLEELSIYRQEHDLDPLTFSCEGSCCAFLDLIDD